MLPYVGGKVLMAPWISSMIPDDISTYVETFGGMFGLYLYGDIHKIPTLKSVIYNDFNILAVNFYQCCLEPETFLKELQSVKPYDPELFIEFRDELFEIIDGKKTIEPGIPDFNVAMMYTYVQTHMFSGKGMERVSMMVWPFGKDKKGEAIASRVGKYRSVQNKLSDPFFIDKLQKITNIENEDFQCIIEKYDAPDALIYLDPPYYDCEHYYANHEFGRDDHLRLANAVKKMKGKFIISYYTFDDLEKWFPRDEYHWEEKDFRKSSGGKKGKKQAIGTEVLIMNYTPEIKMRNAEKLTEW